MKQTLFTLIVALAGVLAPRPTYAANSVETRGDTMTIVSDGDTVNIVSRHVSQLGKRIAAALDDTVINRSELDSTLAEAGAAIENNVYNWPNDNVMELNRVWSRVANAAVNSFWVAMAFIVFISLLFGYLKRRRKYKVIEKAIENNYPLPDDIFDGKPRTQTIYVQQPVPTPPPAPADKAWARPTTGAQAGNARPDGIRATQQPVFPAGMPVNWRALWPAFKWIVAGLAGMLFFAFAEAWPMVGLFTVPLLIGLGKAFLLYQDQVYLYRSTPYPTPEQGTPEQTAAQPAEKPAEAVTPPEFNNPANPNA